MGFTVTPGSVGPNADGLAERSRTALPGNRRVEADDKAYPGRHRLVWQSTGLCPVSTARVRGTLPLVPVTKGSPLTRAKAASVATWCVFGGCGVVSYRTTRDQFPPSLAHSGLRRQRDSPRFRFGACLRRVCGTAAARRLVAAHSAPPRRTSFATPRCAESYQMAMTAQHPEV